MIELENVRYFGTSGKADCYHLNGKELWFSKKLIQKGYVKFDGTKLYVADWLYKDMKEKNKI